MSIVIPYGTSVESTAETVRTALACFGHRVIVTWDLDDPDGEPAVWVIRAGETTGDGEYFRPGQQLVVSGNGAYEILPPSAVAA